MLQLVKAMPPINKDHLNIVPDKPGVYLFKNDQGKVIYVGKSAILSHRVRSYFNSGTSLSIKNRRLVTKIHDFDFITTESEQEALILEANLIKKYHPEYNVSLRDDKGFPYLKIDLNNTFPTIRVTRRFQNDGSKYFGPFASAGSVRKTLKLIQNIFFFRPCTKSITGKETKPCLNYHIHRCLGPCIGAVSKAEYDQVIKQVILFLEGKQEAVVKELKKKMLQASHLQQYEKAALIRDQINAINDVMEGQKISLSVKGEQDVIAFATADDLAYVEIFFIRNNKLTGHDNLLLYGVTDEEPASIITSFIKQYYSSALYIPPVIMLQHPVEEPEIVGQWLKRLRKSPVKLFVPNRGTKKQLLDIVSENARQGLDLYLSKKSISIDYSIVQEELKELLNIPAKPVRIEGYDISNIHGTHAVGSMVVFENGIPKPSHYRRFKITSIAGIDDYSMMKEVLKRRFHNFIDKEGTWAFRPDLLLIDGGKGHLNCAIEVIDHLKLDSIAVASIAKEHEDIFIPGKASPVAFPDNSESHRFLQRVRNESHRFALRYHQKIRSKKSTRSALDDIPGIGPKRRKVLLHEFGTITGIKEATREQLMSVSGITSHLADLLKESL
jgi:excinuclease ABC subunit C